MLVLLAAVALGAGVYVGAGRAPGPAIEILEPTGLFGRTARFEISIDSTDGELTAVDAVIEQGGSTFPLFSLTAPGEARVTQEAETRIRVTQPLTRETHPELRQGQATIVVHATRTVLFGLRERQIRHRPNH